MRAIGWVAGVVAGFLLVACEPTPQPAPGPTPAQEPALRTPTPAQESPPTPTATQEPPTPHHVRLATDGVLAAVADHSNGTVVVYDVASRERQLTIDVGTGPHGVWVVPYHR